MKDYGSSDHDRKDILTDPQHWFSCQQMALYFFSWLLRLSFCFLNSFVFLFCLFESLAKSKRFWFFQLINIFGRLSELKHDVGIVTTNFIYHGVCLGKNPLSRRQTFHETVNDPA
jgi:hypothetical protein